MAFMDRPQHQGWVFVVFLFYLVSAIQMISDLDGSFFSWEQLFDCCKGGIRVHGLSAEQVLGFTCRFQDCFFFNISMFGGSWFVSFHGTLIALFGLLRFLGRSCDFCLFHCSRGIEKVEGELAKFERIQFQWHTKQGAQDFRLEDCDSFVIIIRQNCRRRAVSLGKIRRMQDELLRIRRMEDGPVYRQRWFCMYRLLRNQI